MTGVYPIAGDYTTDSGRSLDPQTTRLKAADSEAEGVRMELHGGRYPFDGKKGRMQKAVIEFICDHDRTGLEGLEDEKRSDSDDKSEEDEESSQRKRTAEEESGDADEGVTPVTASLVFKSYGAFDDIDVLRLDWYTKYACEDVSERDGSGSSGDHWGFFTWFLLM